MIIWELESGLLQPPVRRSIRARHPCRRLGWFSISDLERGDDCRRPIKMSPVCQIEMTLPEDFSGGIRGDGTADERWGADAARGAAGFGSAPADDDGSGAASGARAASGIPAFKDLPRRGSGGPEISKRRGRPSNRRKPEELVSRRCRSFGSATGISARPWRPRSCAKCMRSRSAARPCEVDDRRRAVARSQAAAQAGSSAAPAARVRRRTGAGRRQRALVVRRPRSAVHFAGVRRRRDQPAVAPRVCRE